MIVRAMRYLVLGVLLSACHGNESQLKSTGHEGFVRGPGMPNSDRLEYLLQLDGTER